VDTKLSRKLGLFPVTNIVIANIIGAGIFTTSGFIMDFLGNPWLMLTLWFVGGVIAFCGALAFGELGATFPEAGGEYIFISKLFSPLLGFLSGWLSLIVGFSAPIAASAIGFSEYFTLALPSLQSLIPNAAFLSPVLFKKLFAISLILIFTVIHSRGIIFGARVQNVLTILKVVLIAGLIVAGFAFGKGSFQHFDSAAPFQFSFAGWKSIGLSLMFIMFAYSGWNSATYIGSEIKSPAKVIPVSLLMSTGIVMILYLFFNLFFVYALSPEEIRSVPEIAGLAAGKAFGTKAESIISLLISFALISSLSAFIILGPRVYYSMAKQGYFFAFAAKVHSKYKVPVGAILLQSSIAIILVLSGTFEQILVYMGFSLGIFPILAVLAVFKLRLSGKSALKLPGFPYIHIIFILTGIAMLILAFLERPLESTIAILTALSGVPVFYWFQIKGKKSTFRFNDF
jgi:APA family basic amino acid/polyamine antiporter